MGRKLYVNTNLFLLLNLDSSQIKSLVTKKDVRKLLEKALGSNLILCYHAEKRQANIP
jgi:hypothetical protein